MLSTLLLSSPFLFTPTAFAIPQDPPAEEAEVDAEMEKVKAGEAAAQIKEALKGKEEIVMVATIDNLGQIKSKLVTKEVSKALKIKKEAVQISAIKALRFNEDPTALGYLLKVRKEKSIQDNVQTAVEYAYALGQKGDKKAISALQDNLVGTSKTPKEVLNAKVLALGHIRHKDSVEAILDYAKTTIGRGRRGAVKQKVSREVRGSLSILTGTDQGDSLAAWEDWWYDHRSKFKMSTVEGELDNERQQRAWTKLWMTPAEKEEAAEKAEGEKKKRKEKREKGADAESSSDSDEDF
ncbi:MAG: hypothetical protein QF489_07115 [Planctomycetota bacterium]|jgi:hypothetical protein|nr:hypothetical protein [Planctomycetota bacterium]